MEGLIVERQAICYNSATSQAKVSYCYFQANKKQKRQTYDRKLPKPNIQWRIMVEQYCVYIILRCGI